MIESRRADAGKTFRSVVALWFWQRSLHAGIPADPTEIPWCPSSGSPFLTPDDRADLSIPEHGRSGTVSRHVLPSHDVDIAVALQRPGGDSVSQFGVAGFHVGVDAHQTLRGVVAPPHRLLFGNE